MGTDKTLKMATGDERKRKYGKITWPDMPPLRGKL